MLAQVGLSHALERYPSELSGGMQQRLAIAQALIKKPRILLLDEPFGALDPGIRADMHALVLRLWKESGLTIFMITHDLDSLYAICDKVAVLADKGIVAKAPVQELERSDHPWIKEYFLGPRGRAGQKAA